MKEAAGEANLTVITLVLIGIVAAVAIPMVQNSMKRAEFNGRCQACGGTVEEGHCMASLGNKTWQEINVDTCEPGGN